MIWTTAMDRMLRTGWRDGLSSHEIAKQLTVLGVKVTSAAVRNRRPDLGLKQRGVDVQVFGGKHKAAPSTRRPKTPAPPVLGLSPDSRPMYWERRRPGQCAFPVDHDDEGLIACCGPVMAGARRPYCPFHLELIVSVRHVA